MTVKSIRTVSRDRSLAEPLDLLEDWIRKLAGSTGCRLQLGEHWYSLPARGRDGSITARVRSFDPLPNARSDYWEASIGGSFDERDFWSDCVVFPFLKGVRQIASGDLPDDVDSESFRWLRLVGEGFDDCGWSYAEGPGEWSWVRHPGDEYRCSVGLRTKAAYRAGKPLEVLLSLGGRRHGYLADPSEAACISLLFVQRGRARENLSPWSERPPRRDSRFAVSIAPACRDGKPFRFDLAALPIRGGWIPGRYRIAVRLQRRCNGETQSDYTADISAAAKFVIE